MYNFAVNESSESATIASSQPVDNAVVDGAKLASSWATRVLSWAGDTSSPSVRGAQLRSLHLALVATVTFELTQFAAFSRVHAVVDVDGVFDKEPVPAVLFLLPLALGLCLVALILGRDSAARRRGAVGAALVMGLTAVVLFPNTPNHYPLLVLVLATLALFDLEDPAEQPVALAAIRWFFVVALFLSGLQKILYGAYFGGEFFVYRIATDPAFALPFELIMPAEELARIRELGGMTEGAGPFRTSWWPIAWLSNATWILELTLPFLLLARRTRPWAIAATLLFFIGIEVAPREIFFGFIAIQLVLVFGRRDWNWRLMPFWLLALLVLTALRYLAPHINFS